MPRHPDTATAFEWDEGNEEHLAEHEVTPQIVEAVWANRPEYRRNKKTVSGTWLMVGADNGGTRWKISIAWADEDEGVLRAITGWRNTD